MKCLPVHVQPIFRSSFYRQLFALFLIYVVFIELIVVPIVEAQYEDYYFGKKARKMRKKRIKKTQKARKKILKKSLGKKNYKYLYSKKGTFPGGFGLIRSGRGTLGLGGGGGLGGLGGLGGIRFATDIAGQAMGVSDRLGSDLFGRYGLLSVSGIDDLSAGLIGDVLLDPGAIIGFGPAGRRTATLAGIVSGPVIAAATISDELKLSKTERKAFLAAASLSGLGTLGPVGIGLGAAAGALAGARSGAKIFRPVRAKIFRPLRTVLGAGIGASISGGASMLSTAGAATGAIGEGMGEAGGEGVGAALGVGIGDATPGRTLGAGGIDGGIFGANIGLSGNDDTRVLAL